MFCGARDDLRALHAERFKILKKRGLTLQVILDAAPGYLECGSGMNSRALREIMLSFSEDALAVTAL